MCRMTWVDRGQADTVACQHAQSVPVMKKALRDANIARWL